MYQTIGESISVAGVYTNGKFKPRKFQWRGGTFLIDSSCSVHDFRDGMVRKRRFSVMAKGNVYLLEFNRDTEAWKLEQVWVEN
jgi:hypothetical protein